MENRLEEQPFDLRLRLSLVSHLKMAGRLEEAIHQAQRALQLSPGDRRAKSLLLKLRLERRFSAIHRTGL
jgi:Flp pilus assembly protein TadD